MSRSITVAIPLHASLRWVDSISTNIDSLPSSVTEILLSDQTCLDRAAEVLADRHRKDPRIRILMEQTNLDWASHCQMLIEEASSDWFMIMPHDDIFPPNWIPVLAEALDRHPQALLAYGHMETVEPDGITPYPHWTPPRQPPGVVNAWKAQQMIMEGKLHIPWRGLFRRQQVLREGIKMLPQSAYPNSRYWGVDQLWVLAIALRGNLVHDPAAVTKKRIHSFSVSSTMPTARKGDAYTPARQVLARFGPRGWKGILMRAWLHWQWLRVTGTAARRRRSSRPADA